MNGQFQQQRTDEQLASQLHNTFNGLRLSTRQRQGSEKKKQRMQMLQDVGIMMAIDLLLWVLLLAFQLPRLSSAMECSVKLFWVGLSFIIYQGFFIFRNWFVILVAWYQSKPVRHAWIHRFGWMIVDYLLFTAVVVWAAMFLLGEHQQCDVQEAHEWYIGCVVCAIYGAIYCGVILLLFSIVFPVLACVWCSMSERLRQERTDAMRQRIILFDKVIQRLQIEKKIFTDLSLRAKTQTTCIVCMEDFRQESEVSELQCDERHFFHTYCLAEWMKYNLKCPLCKTEVAQQGDHEQAQEQYSNQI